MKVQYKINERVTIEAEGEDVKEIARQLNGGIESFGIAACGACGSDNIKPVVRVQGKFTYYEWHCLKKGCRAKLSMGQKEKELYPRIKFHEKHPDVKAGKAKVGDYIPQSGWEIYKGQRNDDE